MKKIILLIIFVSLEISAQSEQSSIELPDFVITGRQNVYVQNALKSKPDLISTLSKDFFVPQYTSDELPLLILSESLPVKPSIISNDFYNGYLGIGVGTQTFPVGNLNFSGTFGNYLFNLKAWGSNIKNFINYSDINKSGISLNNEIFISTKSNLFPGAIFKINGSYERQAYYFYGSNTPMYARKTELINGNFSFVNDYNSLLKYGIHLDANLFTLSDLYIKETNLTAKPFVEFRIGRLTLGSNGMYQKQFLKNNLSQNDNYDFFSISPYMKIAPFNNLIIKIGASYYNSSVNTFFAPQASMQFLIGNGFSLTAEYKPYAKIFTVNDFVNLNRYSTVLIDNEFEENKFNVSGTLKYDLDNYFSASVTAEMVKTDNYLYYEDKTTQGFFDIESANDIHKMKLGCNLFFNGGDYGYFIGSGSIQSIEFSNGNFVPYSPKYSTSLTYGYEFGFGINLSASYKYSSGTFGDSTNKIELNSYHNLEASIGYNIFKGFSVNAVFQNILNRSNFTFNNYEEKPFDIILSFEYRW